MRRTGRILLCLLAFALAIDAARADGAFYQVVPAQLHGRPGTLIRAEPMAAPAHAASAYRILFRSTGLHGEPVAVSGVVAIPDTAGRDRAIVVWAHPTTGVADHCAPSLRADVFQRIEKVDELLSAGIVIAAPDYPGLGTDGVHPYLIGISEARSVLDAARAARELPGSGAGAHVLPWGYSQGGHAVLFAAVQAKNYAPELKITGVAAVAPPTELGTILRADQSGRAGRVLSAFALTAWSQLYGIPVTSAIKPHLEPVLGRVASECTESVDELIRLGLDELPFEREGFLAVDVTVTQPWRSLIENNTPGIVDAHIPVFIAQGSADSIVPPLVTSLYVDELCSHKVPVRFVMENHAEHTDMPVRSARAAVSWILARIRGEPPPDDCMDLPR